MRIHGNRVRQAKIGSQGLSFHYLNGYSCGRASCWGCHEQSITTTHRERPRESPVDALTRGAIHADPALWLSAHDGLVTEPRRCGESETGGAVVAHHGRDNALPSTAHEPAASRVSRIPILAARRADDAGVSRLEHSYDLYPIAWRLCLPGR